MVPMVFRSEILARGSPDPIGWGGGVSASSLSLAGRLDPPGVVKKGPGDHDWPN